MPTITQLLDEPATTIAVIGASDDPAKYGSRIYRDLKGKGFTVFAVNPNRDTVDGDPAYAGLDQLPERPTILNFVVPPELTLEILRRAGDRGLTTAWIQPGAESPAVLTFLEEQGFRYRAGACIMVESRAVA
jgi:predicted CoA-binding protein